VTAQGQLGHEGGNTPSGRSCLVRVHRGEVGCFGISDHIGLPVHPHADSPPPVASKPTHTPPEIGGVVKFQPIVGEGGHEGVAPSRRGGLVSIFDGEGGGFGITGDIGFPVRVRADSISFVIGVSPEIGGVEESGAGGGECAHEGVKIPTARGRLVGVFNREIGRYRAPGNIRLFPLPQADAEPLILITSSQVGGVI